MPSVSKLVGVHVFSQDTVNDFGERALIRRHRFFFVKLGYVFFQHHCDLDLACFHFEGLGHTVKTFQWTAALDLQFGESIFLAHYDPPLILLPFGPR